MAKFTVRFTLIRKLDLVKQSQAEPHEEQQGRRTEALEYREALDDVDQKSSSRLVLLPQVDVGHLGAVVLVPFWANFCPNCLFGHQLWKSIEKWIGLDHGFATAVRCVGEHGRARACVRARARTRASARANAV